MKIDYKFETAEKDFLKICDLYKIAGWWKESCSSEQISKLISGSFCFLSAWNENKLVGFGRVISDGFNDGYIQDVYVAENFRKQGIAGNIISKLTEYCKEKNINWIALIAAPGSVTLYEKLGFEKMIDHSPMQFQAK
jgi:spermidine synthase